MYFHKCDIVFNIIIHKYIKNARFYKLSGKNHQENTPAGEEWGDHSEVCPHRQTDITAQRIGVAGNRIFP